MNWYEIIIIAIYLLNTFIMFIYGFHYYIVIYLYRKKKKQREQFVEPVLPDNLPHVTVQLPIFNELYVSERLVRQVMKMDYPKEKFEVQVLDDSIDETQDILQKLCAEYKQLGFDIKYIHRVNRVDHKAGALREAMDTASGDYIAIFDSDFLPPENFLMKTLGYFHDPQIGMVQTRWGHLNREYSMLTKAQSMGIDGHFMLEQSTRSDYDLWFNFNGTAGIWRKECIIDGGNWEGDTLTEDLDLSYRCQLKGWKFHYVNDLVSPAELPVEMTSYKAQQFRWAKGSIQTAIKMIPKILKSDYSWKNKAESLIHLTYYSVHPQMLFNVIWTLPVLMVQDKFFKFFTIEGYPVATFIGMIFMMLGTTAPSLYFLYSQKEVTGSWTKRLKWLPYMYLTGFGIAVHITRAFIEAIIGKKSAFIRTPKFNVSGNKDLNWIKTKYTIPISYTTILELLAAGYGFMVVYFAFLYGLPFTALFPALFSISFFFVAMTSISQSFKRMKFFKKDKEALENQV